MKKTAFIVSLIIAFLIIPCAVVFGFVPAFSGGLELIETLPLSFFMVISAIFLIVDEATSTLAVVMLFSLFVFSVLALIIFLFLSYFKNEKFKWGIYIFLGADILFKCACLTMSFVPLFGIVLDAFIIFLATVLKKEKAPWWQE